jgi:hypothetical protein
MKNIFYKTIITGLILGLYQLNIYAQCTPDLSLQSTGVYPVILPTAKVGLPYNEILQFHVVKDSSVTVPVFGKVNAKIDSFTIFQVIGIPEGMSFICNTSNCTIPGGGNGCAKVTGTPTTKGVYPLQIILKVRVTALGFTQTQLDTMYNYTITVESGVGINNGNDLKDVGYNIFPNPITNNQLNFEVWNNNASNCTIQLYSMQGKEVFNQQFDLNFGLNKNTINTEKLAKGIYLVKVNHENSRFEQKIVIE